MLAAVSDCITIKAVIGANTNKGEKKTMADIGGVAGDRLRSIVERIERLEEEKKALSDDIREVYAEAKGAGFDVKVIRRIIALRKMDSQDRNEMEAVLEIYKQSLDM